MMMNIRSFHSLSVMLAFYVSTGAASTGPCADDLTHTFVLNYDNSIAVNCSWITKNIKKVATRKATYCPTQMGKCPVTCDNCTSAPTTSPIKAPTTSPTTSPTKAPSAGPCVDSGTYQWLNGLGVSVDCSWLTKNPIRTAKRAANYCQNTDVFFACCSTCQD